MIYNIFWRGGGIVDSINKYRKFNFLIYEINYFYNILLLQTIFSNKKGLIYLHNFMLENLQVNISTITKHWS